MRVHYRNGAERVAEVKRLIERSGPMTSTAIQAIVGLSQPGVSRILRELPPDRFQKRRDGKQWIWECVK